MSKVGLIWHVVTEHQVKTQKKKKRKKELDIDCVLVRIRGMLAEITFDPYP